MKEKRNNLLLFGNYKEYFENCTDKQAKDLILLLFDFADNEEIKQIDDPIVRIMYKAITDNIIIGSKRRIASIENGKKGGRPRKNRYLEPKKVISENKKVTKEELKEIEKMLRD